MPGTLPGSAKAPFHGQRAGHDCAGGSHRATALCCLPIAKRLALIRATEKREGKAMVLGSMPNGAQRISTGRVPDMIALVEAGETYRAPKGCRCLPPSR